jgi:hypothetical protein
MVFELASRVTCTASGEASGSGSDACIRPRGGNGSPKGPHADPQQQVVGGQHATAVMRIGNAIFRSIT